MGRENGFMVQYLQEGDDMTDKNTRDFKDELLRLLKREQLIKDYQVEHNKWRDIVYHGEGFSQDILEHIRDFSLAFLPEAKRRQDIEVAESLRDYWETAKDNLARAQESAQQFNEFSQQLKSDLLKVEKEKQELIENSGFSPKDLEKIFDEMLEESRQNRS